MAARFRALLNKALELGGLEWCQRCDALGQIDDEAFWTCHQCSERAACCRCEPPHLCPSCEEYVCDGCLIACGCDTRVCLNCEQACERCLAPWCGLCEHGCEKML